MRSVPCLVSALLLLASVSAQAVPYTETSECAETVLADAQLWERSGLPPTEDLQEAFARWAAACQRYAQLPAEETASEGTFGPVETLLESIDEPDIIDLDGAPRKLCDGTGSSIISWRWGVTINDEEYNEIPDVMTTGKWEVLTGGVQNNIVVETRGLLGSATPATMSLGPLTVPSNNDVLADCAFVNQISLDAIMDFKGGLSAPGLTLALSAHGMLCLVPC